MSLYGSLLGEPKKNMSKQDDIRKFCLKGGDDSGEKDKEGLGL